MKPDEKKTREKFLDEIRNRDWKYRESLEGSGKPDWPGLCGKCSKLEYTETAMGRKEASCNDGHFDGKPMSPHDPVVKCSDFWPRGTPTLAEMAEQARYIVIAERMGQYL